MTPSAPVTSTRRFRSVTALSSPQRPRQPSATLIQLEVLETFDVLAGVLEAGGSLARPGADLLVRLPVAELAGVGAEGGQLRLELVGDVDRDVGILGAGQVDLGHLVRLQALGQEFGEGHPVA